MRLTAVVIRFAALLCVFEYAEVGSAATVYTDRSAYLATTITTGVAAFDDVAVGTIGAFTSGGVSIAGLRVDENLVNLPHSFWFAATGSPPRFATMASGTYGNGFQAMFSTSATAAGFVFNCFACDMGPSQSALDWATLDAGGNVIEQGSVTVDFDGHVALPPPGFLGIVTSMPFQTLRIARRSLALPPVQGNWMVDDVRFTAAPAVTTPANVPAVGNPMLLLTAALLLSVALTRLRRRGGER